MEKWKYRSPGIPDQLFIRGEVPMSKEEIRSIVISKLRLKEDDIVYDIGAGTGSISIEAALQARKGRVYAIERKEEGIALINKNKESFGVENLKVVAGEAPQALKNLPAPDRVVIGGSGSQLKEILELVDERIKSKGRIVITAVTLNTLNSAVEELQNLNYEIEVSNIAVTRTKKASEYHLFSALNPVYVICTKEKI